MLTAILILVVVILVVAMCGMVVAAFNGCLCSSLWLVCGGFGQCATLVGELVAAIAKGLSD